MQLTAEQTQTVAQWMEEGASLAEIQDRLGTKFDIRLTYMEARFLIDDLKLKFKEPPAPVVEPEAPAEAIEEEGMALAEEPAGPAGVSVRVDAITRPNSLVSGSVTFSDGQNAAWYLDQTGRLGMVTEEVGYRPPQADVVEFQRALEKELVKLGI